jgi:uncharacterized protein YaaQ
MRLVVAILHSKDADGCVTALNDAGFPCTRLGSLGGFLDRDNATLLVGVEAAKVDAVVEILRGRSKRRHEALRATPPAGPGRGPDGPSGSGAPHPVDVEVGGATVFVLQVDRFERL